MYLTCEQIARIVHLMITTGKVKVSDLQRVLGFSSVSWAAPITDESTVTPIIVEVDEAGAVVNIVDGFHRANGYADGGLGEVTAILVRADNEAEDNLIAAAAVPEGYNGVSQEDALAEIYAAVEER